MKPVAAGALDTPIFLGRPLIVKDNAGGEVITREELATWANIAALSGREWNTGAAQKDAVDCRITVRLTDGWMPSARWRVRDAVTDRIYELVSAMPSPQLGAAECMARTAQGNSDAR